MQIQGVEAMRQPEDVIEKTELIVKRQLGRSYP